MKLRRSRLQIDHPSTRRATRSNISLRLKFLTHSRRQTSIWKSQIFRTRKRPKKVYKKRYKGIALSKERQKLILLADKSKFGWKTVKEYSQHELAENSDDEKKIYRAEARAAKNSKKSFANRPRPRNYASASQNSYPAMGAPIPTVISRGSGPSQLSRPISTQRASPGMCFACGKPGHWRSSCPFNQKSSVQGNK